MRSSRIFLGPLLVMLVQAITMSAAEAQAVRVTGVSQFQFLTVRPLLSDSLLVEETSGSGIFRRTPDGHIARCINGVRYCRYTRSDDALSTVPLIQDVNVSAWGFGEGIRLYAQLRARGVIAEEQSIWPRADDPFDALVAFLEFSRTAFRVRGGRQWKVSGLGYYNFDGVSALYRPRRELTIEGYGGWSLARGLSEPRTGDALAAVEQFAPEERALIVGGQIAYRPRGGTAVTALYQREIRTDRAGLYSERVAVDGVLRAWRGSMDGSLEVDLANGTVNEGRIAGHLPLRRGIAVNAFARHYRPYFDLWTIWGAFSPVGFDEFGLGASWRSPDTPRGVDLQIARRGYEDTGTSDIFEPVRSDGWRVRATGSTHLSPGWSLQATYGADLGFGAAKGDGRIRLQRELGESTWLAASATAFQRIFEFRVNRGTVYGVGVDGGLQVNPRTRLSGSLAAYRHDGAESAPDVDWSQFRASLRFEWTLGPEPGMGTR